MANTHPIVEPLRDWLAKHQSSLDSSTLGEPRKLNQYLENRIRAAFQAGWDAHERHTQTALRRTTEVKIEKQVETCVDVEVHVSVEDIACAIAEEPNALPDVLRGINNCHTFLKAIPDAIIEQMNEKQKRTIYDAMLLQINRYSPGKSDG